MEYVLYVLQLGESVLNLVVLPLLGLILLTCIIALGEYFCGVVFNAAIVLTSSAKEDYYDQKNPGVRQYLLYFSCGLIWISALFGFFVGTREVLIMMFGRYWVASVSIELVMLALVLFGVSLVAVKRLDKWQKGRRAQIGSCEDIRCREVARQVNADEEDRLNQGYPYFQCCHNIDSKMLAEWADKGSCAALCDLGRCYLVGYSTERTGGVSLRYFPMERDFTKAASFFLKAAERGYSEAQCNLGVCFLHGRGVERDVVEAYKWFSLAASQIPFAREQRASVRKSMSREALVVANRRLFKSKFIP